MQKKHATFSDFLTHIKKHSDIYPPAPVKEESPRLFIHPDALARIDEIKGINVPRFNGARIQVVEGTLNEDPPALGLMVDLHV